MKKIMIQIMLTSLIALSFVWTKDIVMAQEGAEIQTNGEITLVDDLSDDENKQKSSYLKDSEKMKERTFLPSTGELKKYGTVAVGLIVLILIAIYYLNKVKRNRKDL